MVKTAKGKTHLPEVAKIAHFVNADLIAAGISPLKPEQASLAAGKLFLHELERLAEARLDFSFESALSGLAHVERLRRIKESGYRIEIHFLRLNSKNLALKRIDARVKQGGHFVPKADVFRRFDRGWTNFHGVYRQLAYFWAVYDNSGRHPRLEESGP
jgi:predicted ABC-type ATPase